MPFTIEAKNVNDALVRVLDLINYEGVSSDSRNGKVLRLPKPIIVEYKNPTQRVLFFKDRDANPYFHLMESLWMLAGREDTDFPVFFAKNLATYSDDGKTLNGAYGYRWKKHFTYKNSGHIMDQLEEVIKVFQKDKNSRRVVLSMWDGYNDLVNQTSKDIPCNTHVYFDIQDDKLNMTVSNRSNDIIWGMCGANVVHFSVLQEYIASKLEVDIGSYYQFSNNAHCYVDNEVYRKTNNPLELAKTLNTVYPVQSNARTYPICYSKTFDKELELFFKYFDSNFDKKYLDEIFELNKNGFIWETAIPLLESYKAYKNKDKNSAYSHLQSAHAVDWTIACEQWLQRRKW